MKKSEQLGKKLSRNEIKKIQGGEGRILYWCWQEANCYCTENSCPGACSGTCQSQQEGPETCWSVCHS